MYGADDDLHLALLYGAVAVNVVQGERPVQLLVGFAVLGRDVDGYHEFTVRQIEDRCVTFGPTLGEISRKLTDQRDYKQSRGGTRAN